MANFNDMICKLTGFDNTIHAWKHHITNDIGSNANNVRVLVVWSTEIKWTRNIFLRFPTIRTAWKSKLFMNTKWTHATSMRMVVEDTAWDSTSPKSPVFIGALLWIYRHRMVTLFGLAVTRHVSATSSPMRTACFWTPENEQTGLSGEGERE